MKILFIFPHPDDESFGPAPSISAHLRNGDEVFLLTLTRGEATKQRFKLGVDKEEMGHIRFREMQCMEKVLNLSGMTVIDFPDNTLKDINPIEIEAVIEDHIHKLKPDVIVTYAVHGISGFFDHLVTHAVVKRVYCKLKQEKVLYPKRLAFFTRRGEPKKDGKFRLEASADEDIDCIVACQDEDMDKFKRALDCYETYQQTIEESKVKETVGNEIPFEIFGEKHDQPLKMLTDKL